MKGGLSVCHVQADRSGFFLLPDEPGGDRSRLPIGARGDTCVTTLWMCCDAPQCYVKTCQRESGAKQIHQEKPPMPFRSYDIKMPPRSDKTDAAAASTLICLASARLSVVSCPSSSSSSVIYKGSVQYLPPGFVTTEKKLIESCNRFKMLSIRA